jgi:hypothetical protein
MRNEYGYINAYILNFNNYQNKILTTPVNNYDTSLDKAYENAKSNETKFNRLLLLLKPITIEKAVINLAEYNTNSLKTLITDMKLYKKLSDYTEAGTGTITQRIAELQTNVHDITEFIKRHDQIVWKTKIDELTDIQTTRSARITQLKEIEKIETELEKHMIMYNKYLNLSLGEFTQYAI